MSFYSIKFCGTNASVTAKKPNFPERFRADNGKNRNIPERNLSKQTIKQVNQFVDKTHEDNKKKKKK